MEKKSKKTRCFVALELSPDAINYIRQIQKLIGERNFFIGKFTKPENLHLTLKFLGEIDNETIDEVRKRLRDIKFNEFEAEVGEVGVFSENFIRILWIKLNYCDELQKEIDKKLKGLFEPEYRFMGHITIARVKKVFNKKAFLKYIKDMEVKRIKFRVKKFFLKKSILNPEGPVYEDLEEYILLEN